MPLQTSLLVGAAALLHVHSYAQSVPRVPGLPVELRDEVLLTRGRITLADVAMMRGEPNQATVLGATDLGQAPRVGYAERLSRAQIEQAVRRHVPSTGALTWSGAEAVTVRIQSQVVTAEALAQAAAGALRQQAGNPRTKVSLAPDAPLKDVAVPLGRMELRPRGLPVKVQGARTPVWIDVFVDGEPYRSVVVQLAVTEQRRVYVALHAIEAGQSAGAEDFAVVDAEVAGKDAISSDQPLAPFRARRAIRVEQTLTLDAILPSGQVMRGDPVRLVIRSGQIDIETAAVAMTDAGPGQQVRVRPSGSDQIVMGRLSHPRTVTID